VAKVFLEKLIKRIVNEKLIHNLLFFIRCNENGENYSKPFRLFLSPQTRGNSQFEAKVFLEKLLPGIF
jgi:hypothetical protein